VDPPPPVLLRLDLKPAPGTPSEKGEASLDAAGKGEGGTSPAALKEVLLSFSQPYSSQR